MNRIDHPVNALFLRMRELFPEFPVSMVPVPFEVVDGAIDGVIDGTSFFPAGWGFANTSRDDAPEWSEGKVMVIGNDWGDKRSFEIERIAGHEANSTTWRGILDLFPHVFSDLRDCFFTNAFMGLRAGERSSGECPARRDPEFKQRCREFIAIQIYEQKPRLILTLGKWAPEMLSTLAPKLAHWENDREPTWRAIDTFGPIQENVLFDALPGLAVVVCALTHSANAKPNYRHRTYGAHGSELDLLRAAVTAARLAEHGVGVVGVHIERSRS